MKSCFVHSNSALLQAMLILTFRHMLLAGYFWFQQRIKFMVVMVLNSIHLLGSRIIDTLFDCTVTFVCHVFFQVRCSESFNRFVLNPFIVLF